MSEVLVDVISERTAAAGVKVDGVLLKDGQITLLLSGQVKLSNIDDSDIASIYNPGGTGDSELRFRMNSLDLVVILKNGNVGIGDTSPDYKLDVNGEINAVTAFRVADTKVVGAQGAAVADATDAASAITQLNALLARNRTHGLIAT